LIRVGVVDHGAGNLVSVTNALSAVGASPVVLSSPKGLDDVDGLVLPGVGATGPAMERLTAQGFVDPLRSWTRPLLGICVGLQLFFDASEEDSTPGLSIMDGSVSRLTNTPTLPHMGWNTLTYPSPDPLFNGIADGAAFYFVHSFAASGLSQARPIATATHGDAFVAAARQENVVGTQFHPERSGENGLALISNWVNEVEESSC
jgi:glutamine amidotransferase